ncbi:MAG: YfiR family protein [Flavobacteriales bacterium]|nr:YfiR family protein [Flavobacteriales bacterium]
MSTPLQRLLVLALLLVRSCSAAARRGEGHHLDPQANYLYNIAKLVEWKDEGMRQGNFIIGVLCGANLYQEPIKQYSTRTIGKQPIEVRKLPALDRRGALPHPPGGQERTSVVAGASTSETRESLPRSSPSTRAPLKTEPLRTS